MDLQIRKIYFQVSFCRSVWPPSKRDIDGKNCRSQTNALFRTKDREIICVFDYFDSYLDNMFTFQGKVSHYNLNILKHRPIIRKTEHCHEEIIVQRL